MEPGSEELRRLLEESSVEGGHRLERGVIENDFVVERYAHEVGVELECCTLEISLVPEFRTFEVGTVMERRSVETCPDFECRTFETGLAHKSSFLKTDTTEHLTPETFLGQERHALKIRADLERRSIETAVSLNFAPLK